MTVAISNETWCIENPGMSVFRPGQPVSPMLADLPRPITVHVGRGESASSIEDFCALELPGTRVVVGDGPSFPVFASDHPDVRFVGRLEGAALAQAYCGADVVVASSADDIVNALACGVPVAARPEPIVLAVLGANGRGPMDELPMTVGAIDHDVAIAVSRALRCDRLGAAVYASRLTRIDQI